MRAARVAVLAALALAGQAATAEAKSKKWAALPAGGVLRADGGDAAAAKLIVRARSARCRRARAALRIGDRPARVVSFRRRPRKVVLRLDPPAPAARLSLRARRCALRVATLRGVGPAPATAPAPAPAPAPAAAPAATRPLGTALTREPLNDPQYVSTAVSTFRSITPENELKMGFTQPRPGKYDFEAADAVVGFAVSNGLAIRGHTLVYGAQTPPWVDQLLLPTFVEQAMKDHITTLMERYRDRIRVWDVVNEAFDAAGGWQPNPFFDALGPAYVEKAFRAARAADPTAKLYYNEFDAEVAGRKRDSVVAMVEHLDRLGLIDGVGLQMHVGVGSSPTFEQLVETMQIYERMGLEVEITEMDVAARGDGSPTWLPLRLEHQADVYATAARACSAVAACKRLTVWGVSDRFTWLARDQIPLLFDTEYRPKPALAAVRDELR